MIYKSRLDRMSQKTLLASLIIASLGLTACDSDELPVEENVQFTASRIVYDPSGGAIPLPNDLLFSGTTDGTLNLPDEVLAVSAAGPTTDYSDATIAIGSLDGWSTIRPIAIDVELHNGRTIDAASVALPGAIRLLNVTLGGQLSLSDDSDCKKQANLSVCLQLPTGVGTELTYGVDYVTSVSGNTIAIVPIKPFPANSSFMYATTDLIKDSDGNSIRGSVTYELLESDATAGLPGSDTADLQALIQHYEKQVLPSFSIDPTTVTYTGVFTTQSVTDVINTVKTVLVAADAGTPAYAAYKPGVPTQTLETVAQLNAGATAGGSTFAPTKSTISLPYFLDTASIKSYWKAVGDSPVTILGALQDPTIAPGILAQMAIDCPTANPAMPTTLVGCEIGLDMFNHLTRSNPLPAPVSAQNIDVQITIPATAKPAGGYPVNLSLHGLGTLKETTLATAGAFGSQGIATIAIDMPLHGSRGFDLLLADGTPGQDGVYDISATDKDGAIGLAAVGLIPDAAPYANGTALAFVNIESGLTVRDNFRQGITDLLALRLQIAEFTDANGVPLFDSTKVSIHGLSLGAITGASVAAYANDATLVDLNSDGTPETPLNLFFGLNTTSLVAPSGGLADVFNDSPLFGPLLSDELVKSTYIAGAVKAAEEANGEIDLTEAEITVIETAAAPIAQGIVDDKDNATASEYAALLAVVDAEVRPSLLFSIQTQVDPIDPINIAGQLAGNTSKLHVIEVVGDGADNLPDQVLPNGNGSTLTGTETLVRLLGLGCLDKTTTNTASAGVVKFAKGHHSSLIDPSPSAGATAPAAAAATAEMQTQVVTFAEGATGGTGNLLVVDASGENVVADCL